MKKVDALFGANFLIFPTNLTSLVWVLLQRPKELFVVLALGDCHYASAIMESMHWRTVIETVTWTSGYSQLSTVDSTIGRPKIVFLLLLFKNNCLLVFDV